MKDGNIKNAEEFESYCKQKMNSNPPTGTIYPLAGFIAMNVMKTCGIKVVRNMSACVSSEDSIRELNKGLWALGIKEKDFWNGAYKLALVYISDPVFGGTFLSGRRDESDRMKEKVKVTVSEKAAPTSQLESIADKKPLFTNSETVSASYVCAKDIEVFTIEAPHGHAGKLFEGIKVEVQEKDEVTGMYFVKYGSHRFLCKPEDVVFNMKR
jgi:hypothetical protein